MAANGALACDPTSSESHRVAVIALRHLGRPGDAMTAASALLRVAPHDWRSHQAVANLALAIGDHWVAGQAVAQAGRLAPDEPDVMNLACIYALRCRAWRDAEAWAHRMLAIRPDNATALVNLGVAQGRLGHPRQALDSYLAAARIDPNRPVLRKNLASCSLRLLGLAPPIIPLTVLVIWYFLISAAADIGGTTAQVIWLIGTLAIVPALLLWRLRCLPRPARQHLRRHWAEGFVLRPAGAPPKIDDKPPPSIDQLSARP